MNQGPREYDAGLPTTGPRLSVRQALLLFVHSMCKSCSSVTVMSVALFRLPGNQDFLPGMVGSFLLHFAFRTATGFRSASYAVCIREALSAVEAAGART